MKKFLLIASVLALVLAALSGWFFGLPAYRRHKEARFIQQAKDFLAKGDYRNASLSASQVLAANPANLEATRIKANLAERVQSPHALDWRRRMVEIAPTIENKLLLASTALRIQGAPHSLATQILEELKGTASGVAAYHVLAAELDLKLRRISQAEAEWQEASRLEPANEQHQLNLSVLRLQSTNQAVADAARATLESLRSSTNVGAIALRWLVGDSLQRSNLVAAESLCKALLADPRASLDDRLEYLNLLKRTQKPQFENYLATIKAGATNAVEVYAVSAWMLNNGLVEQDLTWLSNSPAKLRHEQPVPVAVVDCYLVKRDWVALSNFLEGDKWSELEFLRLAFLSRAAAEQKQILTADARWRAAVREAGDRLGPLTTLLGLASKWGRERAKEELLWQITERHPKERWTVRELEKMYYTTGNTIGLNRLYAAESSFDPKDFRAKNNLAGTSLLLKLNLAKAHELAREAYTDHPDEPVVAATYAYSQHLQGRTSEGLAVLEKLKPDSLEHLPVSLYYGVLLAASGQTNQAARLLRGVADDGSLLPEEKTLARAGGQ